MISANFRDLFSCNYWILAANVVCVFVFLMFFVGKDLVFRDLGEWMMVEGLLIQLSFLMMRFYMGEETITTKETDKWMDGPTWGKSWKILVAEKKTWTEAQVLKWRPEIETARNCPVFTMRVRYSRCESYDVGRGVITTGPRKWQLRLPALIPSTPSVRSISSVVSRKAV